MAELDCAIGFLVCYFVCLLIETMVDSIYGDGLVLCSYAVISRILDISGAYKRLAATSLA